MQAHSPALRGKSRYRAANELIEDFFYRRFFLYLQSGTAIALLTLNFQYHPLMAITNKIGAPVTGEDFFGRKKELASAHRYLNEKQSLLLSAPRRIGKSSIAKRLIHDKEKENWKCVYVDLQGIATKEAFLRKLIDAFNGIGLLDKATGKIRDLADSMKTSISGLSFGDKPPQGKSLIIWPNQSRD